jgi:hypothetical protein
MSTRIGQSKPKRAWPPERLAESPPQPNPRPFGQPNQTESGLIKPNQSNFFDAPRVFISHAGAPADPRPVAGVPSHAAAVDSKQGLLPRREAVIIRPVEA